MAVLRGRLVNRLRQKPVNLNIGLTVLCKDGTETKMLSAAFSPFLVLELPRSTVGTCRLQYGDRAAGWCSWKLYTHLTILFTCRAAGISTHWTEEVAKKGSNRSRSVSSHSRQRY